MTSHNLITAQAVPSLPATPEPLMDDALALRKASAETEESIDAILTQWHRLDGSYEASFTDQMLEQPQPLKKYALDLAATFEASADALVEFSLALSEAKDSRESLLEDIKRLYRDLNATPVPFADRLDLRARNVDLWQQTYALQRTLDSVIETARERLARIGEPPTLPFDGSEHMAKPGNADWIDGLGPALTGYLSAPLFAMLQRLSGVALPPDLEIALSRVGEHTGAVDADTNGLEKAWLLWGIANGGKLYNDPEGPCGDRMVCVVGDLPTGQDGNAIALGRVIVFDSEEPSLHWQYHEYAHVVDQVDAGSRRFLEDYAQEAAFATTIGNDSHDGNIFEQSAELRADTAVKLDDQGLDPYEAFSITHYDTGYQPIEGMPRDWLAWDAAARGSLDNSSRLWPLRRNMGIEGDA